MDGGIGIGGLNVYREEFSDSNFDLFAKTEYEVGVKKCLSQTFRPLTTSLSQGPFSFLIPSDPETAYYEKRPNHWCTHQIEF